MKKSSGSKTNSGSSASSCSCAPSTSCCCGSSKGDRNLSKVIELLKIINEPNRLKILCLLKKEEKCVCEIWKVLNIPQNLASHHLKALKDAKLISAKQEGRKVIYSSNKKEIQKFTTLLNNFLISNL